MYVSDSKGREAYILVGGDSMDDIQILEATYTDNDREVPEDELGFIRRRYDLETPWLDRQIGMAESIYEGDR